MLCRKGGLIRCAHPDDRLLISEVPSTALPQRCVSSPPETAADDFDDRLPQSTNWATGRQGERTQHCIVKTISDTIPELQAVPVRLGMHAQTFLTGLS